MASGTAGARAAIGHSAAPAAQNPPCIAVIDADRAALGTTERLLTLDGYQAICFGTAADAAAPIRQRYPALVIITWYREQQAAELECVVALQQDPATAAIPILLWCAASQLSATEAQWQATRVLVRTKPLRPHDLLVMVADLALVR